MAYFNPFWPLEPLGMHFLVKKCVPKAPSSPKSLQEPTSRKNTTFSTLPKSAIYNGTF